MGQGKRGRRSRLHWRAWGHLFRDSYVEDTTRMFAAYMAELQSIEHAFCLIT